MLIWKSTRTRGQFKHLLPTHSKGQKNIDFQEETCRPTDIGNDHSERARLEDTRKGSLTDSQLKTDSPEQSCEWI